MKRPTIADIARSHPPTAIVYDNDLMAVSGLSAAQRIGIEVPAELRAATKNRQGLLIEEACRSLPCWGTRTRT